MCSWLEVLKVAYCQVPPLHSIGAKLNVDRHHHPFFNPMFSISAFLLAKGSLSNLRSFLYCSLTSAPPLRKARQREQRQTKDKRFLSFQLLPLLPHLSFLQPHFLPDNVYPPIMFSLVPWVSLLKCIWSSKQILRRQVQDCPHLIFWYDSLLMHFPIIT